MTMCPEVSNSQRFEGNTFFRNVAKHSPNNTVIRPRRPESQSTQLTTHKNTTQHNLKILNPQFRKFSSKNFWNKVYVHTNLRQCQLIDIPGYANAVEVMHNHT